MAFATGRSSESTSFKRYIGGGSFKVIAVNPTAKELSAIYDGREIATEPVYTGTTMVKDASNNDREVSFATVSFIIQADPDKNNGISEIFRTRITVCDSPWYSFKTPTTKVQVIDEYGRTAWATIDEVKAKKIPVYSNGRPANISENYRVAYRGEAELTEFLINFLNIPNVQTYNKDTNTWSTVAHPEQSEARLEVDTFKNFFKGKFGELSELIKFQPENHIKIAIGVKTAEDGKLYQNVYTKKTLRNGATSFDPIQKEIEAAKAAGSLQDTEFFILGDSNNLMLPPLQEYSPVPTSFAAAPAVPADNGQDEDAPETPVDDLPFGEE